MSDRDDIAAMECALGRQLAALRRQARLTQYELAELIGFSRSTVSVAEIGRQRQAREFWQACDKALDTGGVLAAGAEQIDQARDAAQRAAALAAQEKFQARALSALASTRRQAGATAAVSAVVEACPHCGGQITVATTLIPATTPAQAPLRQPG